MDAKTPPVTTLQTNGHVDIVIVGGNFAGISLAHLLLRGTLPYVQKKLRKKDGTNTFTYTVTLCTPNKSFFFKIAAPRAIVRPSQASDEVIFRDIAEAFRKYQDVFQYVRAKAVGINTTDRTVILERSSDSDDKSVAAQTHLPYDFLIIATGTTSVSPLWTVHDNDTTSRDAIHAVRDALKANPTCDVLIAGAGPVGVETAGEIAAAYPGAKITLLTYQPRVLTNLKPELSKKAEAHLTKLGVTVQYNAGLKDPSVPDMTRRVELTDNTAKEADIFINATGARVMNTVWLPDSWLDDKRRIATRDAYFRVAGEGAHHVYAIGDVVSGVDQTALHLNFMTPVAATSIAIDLWKLFDPDAPLGGAGWVSRLSPFGPVHVPAQQEYKPIRDTMMVPIGPKGGVGIGLGIQMPSWAVKKAKGEDFMMRMIEPLVSGTKYTQDTVNGA